jgi:hypothetical protein
MVAAFVSTVLLQLLLVYLPVLLTRLGVAPDNVLVRTVTEGFGVRPLNIRDALIALASGLLVLLGVELWKWFARRARPVSR